MLKSFYNYVLFLSTIVFVFIITILKYFFIYVVKLSLVLMSSNLICRTALFFSQCTKHVVGVTRRPCRVPHMYVSAWVCACECAVIVFYFHSLFSLFRISLSPCGALPSGKMLSHCVKLGLDFNAAYTHTYICMHTPSVGGVCFGHRLHATQRRLLSVCNFICKRRLLAAN